MEKDEREAFDAELDTEPEVATPRTANGNLPADAGKDHAAGVAAMMTLMGMPHA